MEWSRKAAENGFRPSQLDLGFRYLYGLGVEKDLDKAEEWFEKADEHEADELKELEAIQDSAEMECPFTLFGMGLRYATGIDFEEDLTKAVELLRKAAEQGVEDAQKVLNEINADQK